MPSGAKKRKAAKKKKENPPNDHQDPSSVASGQSHGGDDVKNQDDIDSDVGEVSSPASQNLHSQRNPLTEGEEEVIHGEKIVLNTPPEGGVKIEDVYKPIPSVQEVKAVSTEREVRIEDDSNKQEERLEHEKTAKISSDGDSSRSSGSSSSSSDDESEGIKSSQAVEYIAPVVDSETVPNSSFVQKAETSNSVAIDSVDKVNLVVENVAAAPDKVSSLVEKVEVDASLSPVKSVVEEMVEKRRSSFEDKAAIPTSSKVAALELEEEETNQSIQKITTISDPKVCVSQTTDDQLITSYNVPIPSGENGAEHEVDSGVTESVVHVAPRPVQTTSWKSCCGLFEVFSGSGR